MAIGGGRTVEDERAYYEDVPVYASLNNADTRKRARVGNTIYEFDRGGGRDQGGAGWIAIRTSPEGTYPTGTATDDTSMGSILDSLIGNQVTSGITATGGITDPNYTAQGEYFVGPTYTGPTTTDPYVMQSGIGPAWDYQYPTNLSAGTYGYGTGYGTGNTIADAISSILGGGTSAGGTTVGGAGTTKYPGVIPGSDKEQDLDAGRIHHVEMYDANDMWVGAEGTGMGDETRDILGATQYSGGNIGVNAPAWSNPNEFSYGAGDPLANVNALPTVSTWSQPSMTPTTTMPAYSSDPQNAAAARQAAKNMALARTLGPDKGLLSGQAEIERLSNVPGMPGYNVFNNLDSLSSPLGVTMITPMDYINTGTDIQPFQNMTAWDDLVGDVTYDPYLPSGVTTFQSASKPTSIAPGYAAELANQARIADAQARWGSMDDSTQRTMMASAGKPDMGAMLEAMARQQQIADETAMGLDPFGGAGPTRGIFGAVDESRNIRGE